MHSVVCFWPLAIRLGYDHLENMQLLAVGDVPVLNLRHAMELTEACEGPLACFLAVQGSEFFWCG